MELIGMDLPPLNAWIKWLERKLFPRPAFFSVPHQEYLDSVPIPD
ncbi:hypothetical protein ES705_30435 [subsurface metagenome]